MAKPENDKIESSYCKITIRTAGPLTAKESDTLHDYIVDCPIHVEFEMEEI